MKNNNGMISVYALITMSVVISVVVFIVYSYSMEFQLVSSSQKNIQTNYISDSKIKLVLNDDEYYNDQLLPRIKRYIQYGWITTNLRITLDEKDLAEEDPYNIVYTYFSEDKLTGEITLELNTSALYKQIKKDISAKYTLINEFFGKRIPIVSPNTLDDKEIEEFNKYLEDIRDKIILPPSDEMFGVSAIGYEEVEITKESDHKTIIQLFRNNIQDPVKSVHLISEEVFLISANNDMIPNVHIRNENKLDTLNLSGILFIDGNLIVCDDFDFSGILIINGEMIIQLDTAVNINGIVLTNNIKEEYLQNGKLNVTYDFYSFRKYGVYLPKFIDLRESIIKYN